MATVKQLQSIELYDIIWKVTEKNTIANRKKLVLKIDGETWFRYNKSNPEVSTKRYKCVAIVRTIVDGISENCHSKLYVEFENQDVDEHRFIVDVWHTDDGDECSSEWSYDVFFNARDADKNGNERRGRLDRR